MFCMFAPYRLGATTSVIRNKSVSGLYGVTRHVAEVLVRKVPDNQQVSKNLKVTAACIMDS